MIHDLPPVEMLRGFAEEYGWDRQTLALMTCAAAAVEAQRQHRDTHGTEPPPLGPATLAEVQAALAIWELYRNPADLVHFPWPDLARLVGPMAPKDLVIVAAKTGSGKSTFARNLLDSLVRTRTRVMLAPLESDAVEAQTYWACLRLGYDPNAVFEMRWADLPPQAQERLAAEYRWMTTQKRMVRFAPQRFMSRDVLVQVVTEAVEDHFRVVIVDHVHRMAHGPGRNSFEEFSATIRTAKELAVAHQIVLILMAQMNRAERNPIKRLQQPPILEDIRGGGTIEEEGNLVLALHALPKRGLNAGDIAAFHRGDLQPAELVEPNVMAVTCLKKRRDGRAKGRRIRLTVTPSGGLTNWAPSADWEASRDYAEREEA